MQFIGNEIYILFKLLERYENCTNSDSFNMTKSYKLYNMFYILSETIIRR